MPEWLDWLRYRWALRKNARHFTPLYNKASTQQEKIEIAMKAANEERRLGEDRYLRAQRKLILQAERLFVPCPPLDEEHRDTPKFHPLHTIMYKEHTLQQLKNEVRQEQAQRRALLTAWVPLLIGLIGAFTGLIAVLSRRP